MRVLLTGAFGNVGTSALEELLRRGHTVRCFDLRTRANVKKARRYGKRIEVVWGDLRRPEDVAAAVADQEVVVHLAFIIPKLSATGVECESAPDWAREINVGGTRNLIEAMNAQPTPPRLIFASSLHVYGQTQQLPPPRTVDDPVQPIEHYAHHKVECERMVRESGLKWSIFRFGAVLPIGMILDRGMFDVPPDNRIEFVHTRDVGVAIANGVVSEEIWGRILLIGGGPRNQFLYRDLMQRVLDGMGIGSLPEEAFSSVPFCTDWLDTAESERLLHFQKRTLDDYVKDMQQVLGIRRYFIRLFRPFIRAWLLRQSPAWQERRAAEKTANWRGKVAVVTGASSGIGAETARRLAREGLRVVLVARRQERLEALAEEIRASGGEALTVCADLADEQERLRVFQVVKETYGAVDVLVNNAGFGWYGFGTAMPWALARQMIQVNVAAMVQMTLLFLADMKSRGSGYIINVGSVVGSLPSQGVALYGATKSFLDAFTTALHRELRGTKIHVSVVRPGAVATEFYEGPTQAPGVRAPVGRLMIRPARVAAAIWSLLRRPRRTAYVPGILAFVPWVEPAFGWLMDRIGPLLLRFQFRRASPSAGV
jgi:UDP-glucose 4-epimerase